MWEWITFGKVKPQYHSRIQARGDPVPQQSSKMRLLATGIQDDDGDLSIVTRKAGSAGYGSRFTFKDNTISTTEEYGRDAMNAISGFKYQLIGTSLTGTSYRNPTSLVTSSDTLLVAYQYITTTGNLLLCVTNRQRRQ